MAGANIFAGILEGLGKALSGYGMGEIEQRNKLELKEKENAQFMKTMEMFGYKMPKINVKEKSTGQVGTIPANEFDPKLYERL